MPREGILKMRIFELLLRLTQWLLTSNGGTNENIKKKKCFKKIKVLCFPRPSDSLAEFSNGRKN